jgi:hypothetical protein
LPSSTATCTTRGESGVRLGGLLLAATLFGAPLAGQEGSAALPGWLQGCWRLTSPDQVIEEVWLTPLGGAMVGLSRTVSRDTLRGHELMLIRTGANGLVLEANPAGQPSAVFLAAARNDSAITFENLTHDFPQLIGYTRVTPDSLVAVISGTVRDRQRTITYGYARAACPLP